MVADGLVSRHTDHLHGDELGAERQHIELGADLLVLLQDVRQGSALLTPPRELEHGSSISRRRQGCRGKGDIKAYMTTDVLTV